MAQVADANPDWSLPSIVTWATAHMLLAAMASGLLGAVTTTDVGAQTSVRRLQLGLMALMIGLLLGLVVLQQPTILLSALGLALASSWNSAPTSHESRP